MRRNVIGDKCMITEERLLQNFTRSAVLDARGLRWGRGACLRRAYTARAAGRCPHRQVPTVVCSCHAG